MSSASGAWLDVRHRPAAAGPQAAAARRPASAPYRGRPGRGVRRQQFPAGLLGGGRRHRLGAGKRLPGGRQGPLGPSRNVRAGRPRGSGRRGGVRPARGRLLHAVRVRQPGRNRAGRPSAHQVGRLHRLAARRHGADEGRGRAAGTDPRLRRDEQHQPGVPDAGGPGGAGGKDRRGFRRIADDGRRAVLHQSGSRPGARRAPTWIASWHPPPPPCVAVPPPPC